MLIETIYAGFGRIPAAHTALFLETVDRSLLGNPGEIGAVAQVLGDPSPLFFGRDRDLAEPNPWRAVELFAVLLVVALFVLLGYRNRFGQDLLQVTL